jgi:5'-nucleotidase
VKVEISGKTLLETLEHGVARSAEYNEPGRFPASFGNEFCIRRIEPAGNRVTKVFVGGKPLDEKKTYTLATSDFLISRGGDGYTMFKNAKVLIKAENAPKDSEVFEEAIRNAANKTIAPKVENRIVRIN